MAKPSSSADSTAREQPRGEILIATSPPEVVQGLDGTTFFQRPMKALRISGLAGMLFVAALCASEWAGLSLFRIGDRGIPAPMLIAMSAWTTFFGLAMYFYRTGITVPGHAAEFVLWKELLGYRWKSRWSRGDVESVTVCISLPDEDEPTSHLYSVRAQMRGGRSVPVQRHFERQTALAWGERVGKLLGVDVVDRTGAGT